MGSLLGQGAVPGQGMAELLFEDRLRTRLKKAGAPELIGGEREHHQPESNQNPSSHQGYAPLGHSRRVHVAAGLAGRGPRHCARLAILTRGVLTWPHRMALAVHLRDALALAGRFPALAGIDLDVPAGQVVLLRGSNGAGKTTLLRVCATLAPLRSGKAEVLGLDVRSGRREIRRRIAMVAHDSQLYDELTVEENIRFALRSRRAGGGIEEILATLGLGGRVRAVPLGACSAGQRRRCGLATLLAPNVALWLLDEPHAGLDPAGRDLVDSLISDAAERGTTVLMASHDQRTPGYVDRVVTIAGGRVGSSEAARVRDVRPTGDPTAPVGGGSLHVA